MANPHPIRVLLSLLLLSLAAACGGGGGGGGGGTTPPPAGSVGSELQFLIGQLPSDELFLFETRLTSLRLERADGALTGNLLGGAETIELQGLSDRRRLVAAANVPAANYRAVRLGFDPSAHRAKTSTPNHEAVVPGKVAAITGGANWRVPFGQNVQLGGVAGQAVAIDLDLADSIEIETAPFTEATFTPQGVAFPLFDDTFPITDDKGLIDEVRGRLIAMDAGAQTFRIRAFSSGANPVPIGLVDVALAPGAALFLENGASASVGDFFAALVVEQTFLEVHGVLQSDGTILANRVEIEDGPFGTGGGAAIVRLRGRVRAIPSQHPVHGTNPQTFDFELQSIQDGHSVAQPVIDLLDDPASFVVSWNGATVFKWDDGGGFASAANLAPGMQVKVRFAVFTHEPFLATEIELDDQGVEFEGTVQNTSGLATGSFTMALKNHQPAIQSGAVLPGASVTVQLSPSTSIWLKVPQRSELGVFDIRSGTQVRVRGVLSGPPNAPTIAANDVRVRPGRLRDANFVSASAPTSFQTTGGDIKKPFGFPHNSGNPGGLNITLEPDAIAPHHGSIGAFFNALPGSDEVEVKGLATDTPGQIRAFWVRARD